MRTSLALALLLLPSAGCKAEPRPAPRPVAEAAPTPEQDVALRSPLHRLHLYAKEPAACADCHRIEGPKVFSKTRRCLGCHEKKPLGEGIAPAGGLTPPITGRSAVHRGATSDDARECMTCHDFLAATKDPWACAHCHTAEGQRARSSKEGDWASKAPLIKVHAAEACKLCHAPHGEEALHLADCASCHTNYLTRLLSRALIKVIPFWGQTVGAVWGASSSGAATYALGKAAIYFFMQRKNGLNVDSETLRRIYATELERGASILKERLRGADETK